MGNIKYYTFIETETKHNITTRTLQTKLEVDWRKFILTGKYFYRVTFPKLMTIIVTDEIMTAKLLLTTSGIKRII